MLSLADRREILCRAKTLTKIWFRNEIASFVRPGRSAKIYADLRKNVYLKTFSCEYIMIVEHVALL